MSTSRVRGSDISNGLWAFKPCSKRLPTRFYGSTLQARIGNSGGPVCRSQRDVYLWLRTLLAEPFWKKDPKIIPLGWREATIDGKGLDFKGWSGEGNKIRVGVLRTDGVVRPVKPVRRALDDVVERLKASDKFELVEIEPKYSEEGWQLITKLYYTDCGKKLRDTLKSANEDMRPLTKWLQDQLPESLSLEEVEALIKRRNAIRQEYQDRFYAKNLDIILTPAGPAPAQPVGTTKYWNYTSTWNLLDWPALIFPTGLFVEDSDKETVEPQNEHEEHLYSTCKFVAPSPVDEQTRPFTLPSAFKR